MKIQGWVRFKFVVAHLPPPVPVSVSVTTCRLQSQLVPAAHSPSEVMRLSQVAPLPILPFSCHKHISPRLSKLSFRGAVLGMRLRD